MLGMIARQPPQLPETAMPDVPAAESPAPAGLPEPPGLPAAPELTDAQEAAVAAALGQLDLETKVALLAGQDVWSLPAVPAIGLASIVMSAIMGGVAFGSKTAAILSPTRSTSARKVSMYS